MKRRLISISIDLNQVTITAKPVRKKNLINQIQRLMKHKVKILKIKDKEIILNQIER